MGKMCWLTGLLIVVLAAGGCSSKDIDSGPALKFIQGVQNGDKKSMYEAANLTTSIVEESREKLIHPQLYQQTELQRKDSEYILRISGEIDFFVSKIKKMLPKSAGFIITKTKVKDSGAGTLNAVHFITITYGNKDEAMTDKSGRIVKKMVVHLQQSTRTIQGRFIHEFSFNSGDFDKIADRNFEVLSYF